MKCKDCGSTTRKITRPGPRCVTCRRAKAKADKVRDHGRYVESTYGISSEGYWQRYNAQGGLCAICQRANGKTRRLSVDHNHACCPGPTSCGRCVRGLLCRPCNDMLGHVRDSIYILLRAAEYLAKSRSSGTVSSVQRDDCCHLGEGR